MYQYDLRLGNVNALELGFRSLDTMVSIGDITERLKNRLMDLYRNGKISREKAIKLVEILNNMNQSGHKKVWEWMADTKILAIVSYMGFNALKFREGTNDTVTYGILDTSLLKKMN